MFYGNVLYLSIFKIFNSLFLKLCALLKYFLGEGLRLSVLRSQTNKPIPLLQMNCCHFILPLGLFGGMKIDRGNCHIFIYLFAFSAEVGNQCWITVQHLNLILITLYNSFFWDCTHRSHVIGTF